MHRRTLNLVLGAAIASPFLGIAPAMAAGQTLDVEKALAPRIQGDPNAKVTLTEFFSLTCGHCASFHQNTYPKIKEKYIETGQVKMEYRDFPLDGWALRAAAMARGAPENRYFGLIDVLFKQQNNWARSNDVLGALKKIGRLAGLSPEFVEECMKNGELLDGIANARLDAQRKYDIRSTPTFVVGDQKISGAVPFEDFDDVLSDLVG